MIDLYFPIMIFLSIISIVNILMMLETYGIQRMNDESEPPLYEKYKRNFFNVIFYMMTYTSFYCYMNLYYDAKVSSILALMLSLFLVIIFIKVTK